MRGQRLTIHDIAEMAGVSAGTVSRTMNNQPGVGEATRQRVLDIVREHGFRADASARRLSTGRTRTLGIVFPLQVSEVVIHPVYPELLGALGDAAQELEYDVMMFTVSSPDKVEHVLDSIEGRRVDGLVLPAAGPGDPLVRKLPSLEVPAVLIGHRSRSERAAWVDSTHDDAAAALTAGMIGRGRRRLLMLNGPAHISACRLRSRGFWSAVDAAARDDVHAEELAVEMTVDAGHRAALSALAGEDPPDAVVCSSDAIAAGVLDAARELGIRVPASLEVSGFDDSSFAVHTTPQLTTVRMPLRELGRAAIELLVDIIEGRRQPAHVILPTSLVRRGSTGDATPADASG